MRHAQAHEADTPEKTLHMDLTDEGYASLESPVFIESVLQIQPDIILYSTIKRSQLTAEGAAKVMKEYADKDVQIEENPHQFSATKGQTPEQVAQIFEQLKETYKGKKVLIVSHKRRFRLMRNHVLDISHEVNSEEMHQHYTLDNIEVVKLPLFQVSNELDKWILAELHMTLTQLNTWLGGYELEPATRTMM